MTKGRDSGMPAVEQWESYFDPAGILDSLGFRHPEQCRAWAEEAGLRWVRDQVLPGSPWHWGMVLDRP